MKYDLKTTYRKNTFKTAAQIQTSHTKPVNVVLVINSLSEYPNGLVVTGSDDHTIGFHGIDPSVAIGYIKEHNGPGIFKTLRPSIRCEIKRNKMNESTIVKLSR